MATVFLVLISTFSFLMLSILTLTLVQIRNELIKMNKKDQ